MSEGLVSALTEEALGQVWSGRAGENLSPPTISCEFKPKLDMDSMATWTVIPREAGHAFQSKLDSWKR